MEALEDLAVALLGEMVRLAMPGGRYELETIAVTAAFDLDDRVVVIDETVRDWLTSDVHWWRRAPLHIPTWEAADRRNADQYLVDFEASIVRGPGPETTNPSS